jgi:hypothetical protein
MSDPADVLYAAPLSAFTAERKRLADERKAAGDKDGAREITARKKPTMSAWVVNQLHRLASTDMQALFHAGARMRKGDLAATAEQRAALARLRARAAEILTSDGHAASESTLARVQQTLHALSAIGSFDPDPPGQLVTDRDPPGFDVMGGATLVPAAAPAKVDTEADRAHQAELKKLEKAAEKAREAAEAATAEVARLRDELGEAEAAADDARRAAHEAERAYERARRVF